MAATVSHGQNATARIYPQTVAEVVVQLEKPDHFKVQTIEKKFVSGT